MEITDVTKGIGALIIDAVSDLADFWFLQIFLSHWEALTDAGNGGCRLVSALSRLCILFCWVIWMSCWDLLTVVRCWILDIHAEYFVLQNDWEDMNDGDEESEDEEKILEDEMSDDEDEMEEDEDDASDEGWWGHPNL